MVKKNLGDEAPLPPCADNRPLLLLRAAMSPGQTQAAPVVMSGPASALVASMAGVLINTTVIVRSFPMPPRLETRLWHHAFDAGQCLALGFVGAGLSAIFAI